MPMSEIPRKHPQPDNMSPDDATVLDEVKSGKNGVFRVLVDRYKLPLYRYLLWQTGSVELAEDLTQEVFLRVFRAASTGAFAGRASVKTWIFTIAGNCLRDSWRAVKRRRELTDSGLVDLHMHSLATSEPGPNETAENTELLEQLLRLLSELPAEQKHVAHLKFFGGLALREIAEVTGAPLTTVKARLRYALTKLADKFTASRGDL